MFDAGALRLVVLGPIADQPRHGYDIIEALEDRFSGAYSPSPGAIYPMLQMLEEADLVTSATEGSKRLYTVTNAGDELHALRTTLFARMRGGDLTPRQADKLRTILQKVRQDIEAL